MSKNYIPQRGDLVWIDFDPQVGREQRGRRPAVVVSLGKYNEKSALAWVCPVTSKQKGYPFEVALPPDMPVQGVVLVDQLRSLDYRGRRAERIAALPTDLCQDILARARTMLA